MSGWKAIMEASKKKVTAPPEVPVEKQKEIPTIKSKIARYLDSMNDDGRSEPGWLRVSELSDLCIRAKVLGWHYPEMVDKVEYQTRLIFLIGKALHTLFQDTILGGARILKGKWECGKCGSLVEGFKPNFPCPYCKPVLRCMNCLDSVASRMVTSDCGNCQFGSWHYQEPTIKDERLRLTGHSDGIIVATDEGLTELKTISSYQFEKLAEPLEHHKFQLNTYLGMLKKQWGIFLYIDKNGHSLPKEFYWQFNEEMFKKVEDRVFEFHRVWEFKKLPAKICDVVTCSRAKNCIYSKKCFDSSVESKIGVYGQ